MRLQEESIIISVTDKLIQFVCLSVCPAARPEVYSSVKESGSSEQQVLVCLVTGFYPKHVQMEIRRRYLMSSWTQVESDQTQTDPFSWRRAWRSCGLKDLTISVWWSTRLWLNHSLSAGVTMLMMPGLSFTSVCFILNWLIKVYLWFLKITCLLVLHLILDHYN